MKRSTWIVLLVFLALIGLTLFLNKKEPPANSVDTTPTAPVEHLFDEAKGLPTGIDIKPKTGQEVAIERILSRPQVAPADAGLSQPSYVMTVKVTGGTEEVVRIGDLTPTSSGYYASLNDGSDVLVVDKTGLDALLNLVTSPPYASTPTPAPTP
jgi:hypothetical protein